MKDIKSLILTGAILKGFFRNWRSILLLIVFPMILIGTVFLSFNASGMQKIPIGFVANNISGSDFRSATSSFITLTDYPDLDSCLSQLHLYRQYACLQLVQQKNLALDVYYDNTRDPIIWEVIERIKNVVDLLQNEKSMEMASGIVTDANFTMGRVQGFQSALKDAGSKIDDYIIEIDASIGRLRNARIELSNTIEEMDQDIYSARQSYNDAKRNKDSYYATGYNYLNTISNAAYSIQAVSPADSVAVSNIETQSISARNELYSYNQQADQSLSEANYRLSRYEAASSRGKQYAAELDNEIAHLEASKQQLRDYTAQMAAAEQEVGSIREQFNDFATLDPELLISPIVIQNTPTYIPSVDIKAIERYTSGGSPIDMIMRGVNLISLQTLYPTILVLITLFLSLLISSFITLGEINSPASVRVKLVCGVFLAQFISVFVSSMLVICVPIICILWLGNSLFMIPIFLNLAPAATILLLLSGVIVLVGMLLAYVIKKESITLLVSSFFLVFLLFFSGMLLPVERMSSLPGTLAGYFPGRIALAALFKTIFYGQGMAAISMELQYLLAWLLGLTIIALAVKKLKSE